MYSSQFSESQIGGVVTPKAVKFNNKRGSRTPTISESFFFSKKKKKKKNQ